MTDSNLVIVVGPPAVGKMTVGEAIAELTGYRLSHNHHSVDVALALFEFGSPPFAELVSTIRETVFRLAAESDLPGLIFTFVWAFDHKGDLSYMQKVTAEWQQRTSGDVYFLELSATLDERLQRNESPRRLAAKTSKQDVAKSRENLLSLERYELNSTGDAPIDQPYLRVDNTDLTPQQVAHTFVTEFNLAEPPR
jgi:hypothetical protein